MPNKDREPESIRRRTVLLVAANARIERPVFPPLPMALATASANGAEELPRAWAPTRLTAETATRTYSAVLRIIARTIARGRSRSGWRISSARLPNSSNPM
jgi:hypothetical protein